MNETLSCQPIGYFRSKKSAKYMAARQATLASAEEDFLELCPENNFEQALEDLQGFGHIWLIYWLHKNENWKPKVNTPRGGPKRGVFATRSPHRPNPLGLSCVELIRVEGRKVYIGKNDLLDGTPIFDIKPYLVYADSFSDSSQGWTEGVKPLSEFHVEWSELSLGQAQFLQAHLDFNFMETVEMRLSDNPGPFLNHRIRALDEGGFELALKTWRIRYGVDGNQVKIEAICSGYDEATLNGEVQSRWDDVLLHVDFLKKYPL